MGIVRTDFDAIKGNFPKSVPVFPLPGTVLFPGALMPLHIFEPRYRAMVRDALEGDRLIAMGLLAQCSRDEYRDKPPFHETVCVGHLLRHEELAGGKSNILLLGVSAGAAASDERGTPYRTAGIELLEDESDLGLSDHDLLQRAFTQTTPGADDIDELRQYLGGLMDDRHIASGVVSACAITATIPPLYKLALLEERSLHRRLEKLVEYIERAWQWN
jgi:Lon protease-like protein